MALCPPAVGGALCTDAGVRVRVVGTQRRDAGLEASECVTEVVGYAKNAEVRLLW